MKKMLKELNQKSSVCWIAPNEFNEGQLWAESRHRIEIRLPHHN